MRTTLSNRRTFQGIMADAGLDWWEYMQHTATAYKSRLSITFAFVATLNHFVLDRGGKVFKQSAPVIKLPEGATEDDHLGLLGVLNSSTACFWLKQNSYPKGGDPEPWSDRYEFTGTTLGELPLPASMPLNTGRKLDTLAQQLVVVKPGSVCANSTPTRTILEEVHIDYESLRGRMISAQEELDWQVYRLYDLIDDDLTYHGSDAPELALGERAFEIVLARRIAHGQEQTTWFERHGSKPITALPDHWPTDYRELVEQRIELIESHPFIRLLERPEQKRRWASESWAKQEERALREWLLDRIEDRRFWFDAAGRPRPRSIANLADDVARDTDVASVLGLWRGRPDTQIAQSLERLLAGEAVPYLAAYRSKPSGLRNRKAWEHTWALQRQEDAGSYNPLPKDRGGNGPIPVPPKYTKADFTRVEYWHHRGKLDVPKERFILYPDAGRDTDPSPVLGWAGWDHAQQALALATLIQEREADGWAEDRLVPVVAGLAELQPWVRQWHHEPEQLYGGSSPADFFDVLLDEKSHQVGRTIAQLAEWRPAPARRGRKAKP